MAKSIKLNSNTYIDSSSVSHNRQKLSDVLNKVLGVVLYENYDGSNGTITLNDSVSNYKFIEIFYKSNDSAYSSVRVDTPNGKRVSLQAFWSVDNVLYGKIKQVLIDNNKINNLAFQQVVIDNGVSPATSLSNFIYITKVIGYK